MQNHNAPHPLSIAPMMDRTDRHFRMFLRLVTRRTLLYSEMVTTGALIHGDRKRFLAFDPLEKPLVLQLGGDDPDALATCAQMAEDEGYDEVNLNVGCPSDRVQKGCFGAVLMKRPEHVRACVEAMKSVVQIPVTVKHRIGVDDLDRYEDMLNFVSTVQPSGSARFTVHARKAWLQGLSPKQNRNIPPLRYDEVYRLKQEIPEVEVEINGGIKTLADTQKHLQHVDAVMIGRAAVDDPWLFSEADRTIYGTEHTPDREDVARAMIPYAARWVEQGGRVHHISRHMLHLFRGQPGARVWRQVLTEGATRTPHDPELIERALAARAAQAERMQR